MGQSQGKETILDCRVTANPHGYLVWKKDGKKIDNTGKFGITIYEDDRYTRTLSLRIGNLNKGDFGKYECYAENRHGNDVEEMTLYGTTFTTTFYNIVLRMQQVNC
jgi:neuronal growth regulator 1